MTTTKKNVNEVAALLREGLTRRIAAERAAFDVTNRVEYVLDDMGCFDHIVEHSLDQLSRQFNDCLRIRLSAAQKIDGLDYKKAARQLLRNCRTAEPSTIGPREDFD